jgi:hypothetical protein
LSSAAPALAECGEKILGKEIRVTLAEDFLEI